MRAGGDRRGVPAHAHALPHTEEGYAVSEFYHVGGTVKSAVPAARHIRPLSPLRILYHRGKGEREAYT